MRSRTRSPTLCWVRRRRATSAEMFSDQTRRIAGGIRWKCSAPRSPASAHRGFVPQSGRRGRRVGAATHAAPHREAMRAAVAAALGVSADAVSIKGKTNEGMGWIGRGEGLACWPWPQWFRSLHGPGEPDGRPGDGHVRHSRMGCPTVRLGAFLLEPFADFLALERSASQPTLDAYAPRPRALRRVRGATHAAADPASVPATLVSAVVLHLKDLGLAPASIRRNVCRPSRTYYRFLTVTATWFATRRERSSCEAVARPCRAYSRSIEIHAPPE